MFQKDTLRLIKKTFNRFFTLVCIVTIGVAFMMGLLATSPVMRKSVDKYFDDENLQDFQLYSSYGFCDEDIEKIKELDIVEGVFASKMVDAYLTFGNGDIQVARVREINTDVNQFELTNGRLPVKDNEAVIMGSKGDIGKKFKVYLNDEDEIFDHLEIDEFEIVGTVKSSEYMAKVKSTSNLDNLDLNTIIYVPNSVFNTEYYTTVYINLKDTLALNSFDDEYFDTIEDFKSDIENLANKQEGYLKETLLEDYRQEIEDGEKELAEKRADGQKELENAKQELEDANIKLIAGQMQLDQNIATLNSTKERLNKEKELLDKEAPEVNKAIKEIEEKDGQDRSFEEIYAEVSGAYSTYITLKASKTDSAKDNYRERIDDLNEANQRLYDEVIIPNQEIVDDTTGLYSAQEKEEAQRRIDNANQIIADNNALITRLQLMSNDYYDDSIQDILDQIDANANGSIEDTYRDMTKLMQAKIQIDAGYEAIKQAEITINESQKQIDEAQKTLDDGRKEYEKGLKKYKDGLIEFDEKIEEAENDIRKAKQDLEELPDAHWIILDRDSHYAALMYKNTCDQMESIGIVMPVLFYLVAALVCMTTMTRLIDEQRGQIGIFRALGFSRMQVIGKYLTYALLASLIGSVIGVVVGMLIFPTVIYSTWRLMYDLPEMIQYLPIDRLIICLSAFIVLMEGVTYFVVRKSLVEVPAQLMRPKAPKNAKKVFLEYIPILWERLSFTSKITSRNLIRYKTRFFMTVIGVAGCTGLLVLGFGIKDSISDVVNLQFGEVFDYEYTINLNSDHTIDDILEVVERDLNNDEVVPYMSYTTKVVFNDEEDTINVEVMDARACSKIMGLKDKDNNSEVKLTNRGVIISEKFAQNNGIKKGDIIQIESKEKIKANVKVEGITHMYFQHYMFISEAFYNEVFEDTIHYTNIAVRTDDGSSLMESVEEFEDVASVTDFGSFIEQFNIMIEALDFIILVIILTAGALAFVVLVNLTQVNISERIREIATLKVLGFRNNEVNSYIFKEIVLLTTIGGVIGLPLGKIELKFVMNVINMEMIMFPTNVKLPSYLISYAITFIFTIIVLIFTMKPLRNIEMVESLKSVE